MILLLTADGDLSCDLVIDWLNHYNYDYLRINSFELFNDNIDIKLDDDLLSISLGKINVPLQEINVVWYRKFGFFEQSDFYKNLQKNYNSEIVRLITREYYRIAGILLSSLKNKKWITNPFVSMLNKFEVLKIAKECDLAVPNSQIINSLEYFSIEEKYIVKSIVDPIIADYNRNKCMMYTNQLNKDDIENLPDRFFPSLIQEKIDKKFEIRIFYLNGKCYSMAIFSQNDKQTQLDFRQYNWDNPNRYVPYKLSKTDNTKIKKLMNVLELNCGSIDMIMGTDDKLYFLEVNPTGQFGMVDFPCNYGLHKIMAETLIEMDR